MVEGLEFWVFGFRSSGSRDSFNLRGPGSNLRGVP